MKSEKLIRATPDVCAQCQCRIGKETRRGLPDYCNYIGITGHSRIIEDGEMAYDPEYCDKFIKGDILPSFYQWTVALNDAVYLEEKAVLHEI